MLFNRYFISIAPWDLIMFKIWFNTLLFCHLLALSLIAGDVVQTNLSKRDELKQYLSAIKNTEEWQPLEGFISKAVIDVNSVDDGELTLLHWSTFEDDFHLALLLIENGADVNVKDFRSATPLFYAVDKSCLKFVILLLAHGADSTINVSRSMGPLICAHGLLSDDPTSKDKQKILELIEANHNQITTKNEILSNFGNNMALILIGSRIDLRSSFAIFPTELLTMMLNFVIRTEIERIRP